MATDDRYLFLPDLQIPYEAEHALKFCKRVQAEFKIPEENIYNVGDELDLYWGSTHKKDPDADMTPRQELRESRKKIAQWIKAFPIMKLAISNHGLRWLRKAFEADIPSEILRSYRSIIDAPKSWIWKERWNIQASRARIAMIHGMGYSGQNGHRNAAMDLGCNVVHGHLHSHAGISYINTDGREIYGFNVGCLIDTSSFAFKYGKYNRSKPVLGCGVVINGGTTPIFIPYGSL